MTAAASKAEVGAGAGDQAVGARETECYSQDVANTWWAYATMGRKPGGRALGALEARALFMKWEDFCVDEGRQLHQYWLSCAFDEGSRLQARGASSQQLHEALESACRQAFAAAAAAPSESQQGARTWGCECRTSINVQSPAIRLTCS